MNAELHETLGPRAAVWKRLHAALMPDYTRQACAYWCATVLTGGAVLAHALHILSESELLAWVQIAAGALMAMLAGFFPFRVPRSKTSFTAGEIFIFLLLLVHGPAAATLAAAGEALVGSWRTSKRWTSRIVSPATASIAMFWAGSLLHVVVDFLQSFALASAAVLLVATTCCALLYFLLTPRPSRRCRI